MSNASTCQECGYDLRGLPAGRPCPECGHLPDVAGDLAVSPRVAWGRSVFAGLTLLLRAPARSRAAPVDWQVG